MRLDAQIRPLAHVGIHIGARRAPALATVLRHLVAAEPFMVLFIEVLANAELRLARSLMEDVMDRIVRAQLVDMQRAALAMIFAVEIGVVLRALEVGQHIRIRPAGVAERGPVVVVPFVAADIDHRVDRRGTAEALAARLIADAAVQSLLRHSVERPVGRAVWQSEPEWRGDPPTVVPPARIEQRH